MHRDRIRKIQAFLKGENLDGLIVNRLASIRYLCGFTGSAGIMLIQPQKAWFLTDFRYKEQSRKQVRGAKTVITKGDTITELKKFKQFRGKNLRYGFESDYLLVNDLTRLKAGFPGSILVSTVDAIEQFSVIKDKSEIANIQSAVDISDTAFERILGILKPGIREIEVAAELEYQMKMLGSEKPGFETIVASGYRSALPHGVASVKKIARGDFVIFDFGATCNGYVSDITRTVVIGKATARQKKIYNVVLRAQRAAIRKVKAGIDGRVVDAAARRIIDKAGYKKHFGHGTGHGIGLFVHSKPRMGTTSTDVLRRGMVVTVEPGVYLPGWGGVRIEDDVVVTLTGCRVLNRAPKNLLEL
ncbi:MAG: aminopeptidase P family protein [Candidatus Zixiibacteriota bacterium]|nr:MAG: aminopeptidase P family protein [candidate division Zixibacteria bacterium]